MFTVDHLIRNLSLNFQHNLTIIENDLLPGLGASFTGCFLLELQKVITHPTHVIVTFSCQRPKPPVLTNVALFAYIHYTVVYNFK